MWLSCHNAVRVYISFDFDCDYTANSGGITQPEHRWTLLNDPFFTSNCIVVCMTVVCTHGMPISNRLFWISCLPSIVMHSWMHSSMRQPAWAHWRKRKWGKVGQSGGGKRIQTTVHWNHQSTTLTQREKCSAHLFHSVWSNNIKVFSRSSYKPVNQTFN